MNNKQSKFIITQEGTLRLKEAKRHCELLLPGEICIGGGYYELNYLQHRLQLSGASSQYGEPRWEELKTLTLSAYYRGLEIIYTSWDGWREEFPISERIPIHYK